jgi:hypothetical protein
MSTSRGFEMSSGPAAGRVVGCAVLPAPPDHSCPGAGEHAHGVGVVAAAGDGLAVDLDPHRRAVGSQCDHTSDGAGTRSMPAFRSVVSAPVSFVWEDIFYELKAGPAARQRHAGHRRADPIGIQGSSLRYPQRRRPSRSTWLRPPGCWTRRPATSWRSGSATRSG